MKLNSNLRIDKNIAYNIIEISKIEDVQTQIIIKSLLIYFSFSYQCDLFGYGQLDPYDFANKMHIDKDLLFRKHPNSKFVRDSQRNGLSLKELHKIEENNDKYNSDTRIWDSYLENALYILVSTPIFEQYKGSTDKRDFIGLRNHILMKEVQLFPVSVNKGRTQKLYYRYKLDDYFERNLRRFFLQIDFESYRAAKKKNIDNFFLTIMNIFNSYKHKGINRYHWNFNDMVSHFNVSPNLKIKNQKQKLNFHFRNLEKILSKDIPGIKFDWIAGEGQRWKYVPIVTWDKIDVSLQKNQDFKVVEDVFLKHLRKNLYEIYLNQTEENSDDVAHFYFWLRAKDMEQIKISCYISTYSIYNKVTFPKPETLANLFFREKIKKSEGIDEMEKCFNA